MCKHYKCIKSCVFRLGDEELSAIGLQYVPYGTDDFVLHVMDDRVEIWITDWKRAAKKVCIHKEKLM